MAKTHDLKFYAMTLPNVPWDELLARYKSFEDLGFDIAGVADHFVDWSNPPSPWFEAWTLAAAIARETTHIRISTCVSQFPLRHPAMLAFQALTVDHISNGRLDLGLGIGLTSDPSYEMMGLPNWGNKERVARFKEYVPIVDQLLSNEVSTYKGQFYEVNGAVMCPRPVQSPRPPIMIAAMGPVMLKIAARHADIWNSLSFAESFESQMEEISERVALIDQHCASLARDPATLRRSYHMFDADARKSGGLISYYESEDLFVEMVERVIALGFTEIGLYYPTIESQLPKFEKIATQTIPQLRANYAT
ncbi:MAG: LLM class flavin-dependent oxidoreductase [Alphaproteobacteria bacterium]|nr:LLM class flavin-dependent oxidoreductase [Alphaproteobacteria bacterium]